MNGYDNDKRKTPYTNNRIFSPALIWGMLTFMLVEAIAGTAYIVRMEGDVAQNEVQILHVKELQDQQNDHTTESLKRIEKKQEDIERLLRENLKKETRDVR